MADTGERREITRFVNAKEAETVHEVKDAISKTKQQAATSAQAGRSRKTRSKGEPASAETIVHQRVDVAADHNEPPVRLVNTAGAPNGKP